MEKRPEPLADCGLQFSPTIDDALLLLEALEPQLWRRLAELAAANLRGQLTYEAWRAAVGAILSQTVFGL
jgi:hypothetical protein